MLFKRRVRRAAPEWLIRLGYWERRLRWRTSMRLQEWSEGVSPRRMRWYFIGFLLVGGLAFTLVIAHNLNSGGYVLWRGEAGGGIKVRGRQGAAAPVDRRKVLEEFRASRNRWLGADSVLVDSAGRWIGMNGVKDTLK